MYVTQGLVSSGQHGSHPGPLELLQRLLPVCTAVFLSGLVGLSRGFFMRAGQPAGFSGLLRL
jgi:hypothetical protein